MSLSKNESGEDSKDFYSLPFWSWNDRLEEKELIKQINWMHKNDIGGFFMHARSGLVTEYLSDEWMSCIKTCAEEARRLGMSAWAYDENGWPSGFAGGKLLEDPENHDRYLTCASGSFDPSAMVSYYIDGDDLIRSEGGQQGEYLNIYEHYSTSTADILNPDVVEKFINMTHERYKSCLGDAFSSLIKGFFTDEPQYYRWDVPYTPSISAYFKDVLKKDILDGIGLLFVKKNGYRQFRYDYWKGMQSLMLGVFAKKVYQWCENNGVRLTGHYIEEESLGGQMMCCAGVMPLYEYEHIPGIDRLGRYSENSLSSRQILSVTAQLGKKQVLCEMYAGCGWDVTPRELKRITESLYINGVNVICQHLLPYSERGNRIHDYPAHFSAINPWVRNYYDKFNRYFNRIGALLADYPEQVRVAVLHPMRSAYFDYDRSLEDEDFGIAYLDDALAGTLAKLEKDGINFHFLDETLLAKYGSVSGGVISCGRCSYDVLIIPYCITMDENTERLLHEYVNGGGKVYLCAGKPLYIEGREYAYDYLESNITWDDILTLRPAAFEFSGGKLCVSCRRKGETNLYMLLNRSESESCEVKAVLPKGARSYRRIFPESGKEAYIGEKILLAAGESAFLIPDEAPPDTPEQYETVIPSDPFEVICRDDNALTLDRLSYSFDGKAYSDECTVPLAFKKLLELRYSGTLWLKYTFSAEIIPSKIYFRINLKRVGKVYVNGTELKGEELALASLEGRVKIGLNEIVLKTEYSQSENVYDVLFGENVTEGLKNCLLYDSELEPLILYGDFGVTAPEGFKEGSRGGIFIADKFVLSENKKTVSSLVKDGFPFFAGQITLKTVFSCGGGNTMLHLPGRWHAAEVKVNGTDCGYMLLSDTMDISGAVIAGENELELKITVGNRNLYGPHHSALNEEPFMQGPDIFEFNDSDEEKNRENYLDAMTFVEPLF